MQDRELTPQESMQVIEQMLETTRKRLIRGSGVPSLIWGYTTLFTSLLIYVLARYTWDYRISYLWLLIPILGGSLTWINHRKKKNTETYVRTQIEKFIDIVWFVIGTNMILICIWGYRLPILSLMLILNGMGTAIMGFTCNLKVFKYSSIFGMIVGYIFLARLLPGNTKLLCFGIAFFFMHCLPGHYLCYIERKRQTHA